MDKTSNIALNSTRMQQAHYFRHILHAEKITGRPEGGGTSLHVHPPKYATEMYVAIVGVYSTLYRISLILPKCLSTDPDFRF